VDGVAGVLARRAEGGSEVLRFELPGALARYFVEKGSVTVDGVSLTVNALGPGWFEVALIPETLARTTLGALSPGAQVNLEADIIGKYVARLHDLRGQDAGVTEASVRNAGFTSG
jgi:riboflavin synthase